MSEPSKAALKAACEIQQAYDDEIEGDSETIAFLMAPIQRAIDSAVASERERLEVARDLLVSVRNKLDCGSMDHTTTWDQHGVGDPCPVVARYQQAIDSAVAAKQEQCAKVAIWKMSTIGVIQLYAEGQADDAGKRVADEIRALPQVPDKG